MYIIIIILGNAKGGRDPGGGRVEPVNSVAEGEGGVRRSGSVPRRGGLESDGVGVFQGGETGIRLSGSVRGGGGTGIRRSGSVPGGGGEEWSQTEWERSGGGGGEGGLVTQKGNRQNRKRQIQTNSQQIQKRIT